MRDLSGKSRASIASISVYDASTKRFATSDIPGVVDTCESSQWGALQGLTGIPGAPKQSRKYGAVGLLLTAHGNTDFTGFDANTI